MQFSAFYRIEGVESLQKYQRRNHFESKKDRGRTRISAQHFRKKPGDEKHEKHRDPIGDHERSRFESQYAHVHSQFFQKHAGYPPLRHHLSFEKVRKQLSETFSHAGF